MKLIHGILGCVLAAGLTAHAAGPANNGTVIDNTVYTPLDIKLKTQYNDKKGTIHEASLTSKEILKLLGFPKGDKLATDYNGFGDSADVFVIDKNGIVADLTSEDVFSIDFSKIINKRDNSGKNDSFDDSEKGTLSLSFDFTGLEVAGVVAQGEAPPPSDEFSFDCDGVYIWQKSGGAIKDGDQKVTTKLTAVSFVGNGFDSDLAPAPSIQSDSKTPGSGDFLIKDGTAERKRQAARSYAED